MRFSLVLRADTTVRFLIDSWDTLKHFQARLLIVIPSSRRIPTLVTGSPRAGFQDRVLLPFLLLFLRFGLVPLYRLMGLVPPSMRRLAQLCLLHGDFSRPNVVSSD